MNQDELKPLWESYKEQIGEEYNWSQAELTGLIKSHPVPMRWYQRVQRPMLHFCVSFFLITITSGC